MMALPWEDNVFDGSLCISTINHHLRANIVKSLDEVLRVLKPGGLFLVDFLSTGMEDYQKLREQVAAGEISEPEPNTFVDERPDLDPLDDSFLPHHYCTEDDLRDLMKSFEILKMWTGKRDSGKTGKWVVWGRKPVVD
jgi:tellurite methyltransferase